MKWLIRILLLACFCPAMIAQQCPTTSKLEMVKGEYVRQPGVTFTLQNFLANLVPKSNTAPQCFIKSTEIQHGRVYVSMQSLTRLFQEKMEQQQQQGGGNKNDAKNDAENHAKKPDDKSADKKDDKKDQDKSKDDKNSKDNSKGDSGGQQNIHDIAIKTKDNQIEISGKIKKGIDIPFDLIGPVDVANGHVLRFQIDKIKAAGIESKGLLDALGMHLTKMLHPDVAKGVTVQDNAILFDTEAIANIKGQMSHVAIAGENLVIDFASAVQRKAAQSGKSAARHVATATPVKK